MRQNRDRHLEIESNFVKFQEEKRKRERKRRKRLKKG